MGRFRPLVIHEHAFSSLAGNDGYLAERRVCSGRVWEDADEGGLRRGKRARAVFTQWGVLSRHYPNQALRSKVIGRFFTVRFLPDLAAAKAGGFFL
jgi:hypothetical protein